MELRRCAHCGNPLEGRQRKYCTAHASLARLLWNRETRRRSKALHRPDDEPYWKDGWRAKTKAERQRYWREYMRDYRRGVRRLPDRKVHSCAHCTRALQAASALGVVLISAIFATACAQQTTPSVEQRIAQAPTTVVASINEVSSESSVPDPTVQRSPRAPELTLQPAHRRILEATGFLAFVEANIDVLHYYHWPAFATAVGPAWGLASYEAGRRVADIAIEGRADRDVVATIVHEAAHLAGLRDVGQMYDQPFAEAAADQFLTAYNALFEENPPRSHDGIQSPRVIELRIVLVQSSVTNQEEEQR